MKKTSHLKQPVPVMNNQDALIRLSTIKHWVIRAEKTLVQLDDKTKLNKLVAGMNAGQLSLLLELTTVLRNIQKEVE